MKHHFPQTSKIGTQLCAEIQALPPVDADIDPCIVGHDACFLSPGIEHLFVSMTAKAFVDAAWATERLHPYHQMIYCPHTTVEGRCGFDLSVGVYNVNPRIRSMHKLLYATKKGDPWCDEDWEWDSSKQTDNTSAHIGKLVEAHTKNGFLEPILVLHVCYCLHEYRRMGTTVGGVVVPDFRSPLRTVIIDMSPIGGVQGFKNAFDTKTWAIRVTYSSATQQRNAQVIGPQKPVSLKVLTLDELIQRFLPAIPPKA